MKCPICGKDLDLQNKQIGTSENGDPIFNEYAICHSCKKQWNLDKQRAKKIAAKKAAKEKAKAEAEARAAEEKAKAEAAARAAEEKKKRKLMLPPVPLKRNELPAEKQKPAPAKKRLPALLLTKGFQKKKLNVFLRREPEPAKPLHRKLPLMPLPLIIPKSRNMGTFQRKKSVISVKKQFARDTKICLQLTLTVKLPRRKKKEEAETAKAKEDVKSRKMDDYDDEKSSDDEDDDEYEYVDEYPRFRPGRIILGIISLLAFGFCIYKGFVTGLSTSGADVTSAPGMNYVIVALCMLVTALLYFIMNNRDTLFAFLIPMIVYIGSAVFAFLKHGDEFELLILAGVSGVLAVISLILAIASRGGDDYDDEDDYDDPFEEEHDN